MDFDDFSEFTKSDGPVEVGRMCYTSLPCQHKVRVNGNERGLMLTPSIVTLLKEHNQSVPGHFKECAEYKLNYNVPLGPIKKN